MNREPQVLAMGRYYLFPDSGILALVVSRTKNPSGYELHIPPCGCGHVTDDWLREHTLIEDPINE